MNRGGTFTYDAGEASAVLLDKAGPADEAPAAGARGLGVVLLEAFNRAKKTT